MYRLAAILCLFSIPASAQVNTVKWYDPISVAGKTFGNSRPRIALDRNFNPVVIWTDQEGRLLMARWKGNSFDDPIQVNPPGNHVFSEPWSGPEIASIGDTIYIAYKQVPEETKHIFLLHSFDGAKHVSIETQVDDSDGISRYPSLAINPLGNPLVSYLKLDAGYVNPRFVVTKSVDLGESFLPGVTVPDFSGGTVSDCSPGVVRESGNATVFVYRDNLDLARNIWVAFSSDSKLSFARGIQADSTGWTVKECPAQSPSSTIIADTLYTVYSSAAGDTALIYLSKSSVTGVAANYSSLTGTFPGLTSQISPIITSSGDATAVVWQQTVGTENQICFNFTQEITDGFPLTRQVIANGNVGSAAVALGGGHAYVVWQNDSSGQVMCRIGRYEETLLNKLLSENTTVYLQPSEAGNYFVVSVAGISSCLMVDSSGKEYEMDMKCKKGSCRIYTDELDPGLYVVKIYDQDDKIYTYKYIVKPTEDKPSKHDKD